MNSDYCVTHQAYCGMTIPLGDGYTYAEARERAKRRIDWFKARIGGAVTVLKPNTQWELEEPDDCMMIPDACGVLTIERLKDRIIQ